MKPAEHASLIGSPQVSAGGSLDFRIRLKVCSARYYLPELLVWIKPVGGQLPATRLSSRTQLELPWLPRGCFEFDVNALPNLPSGDYEFAVGCVVAGSDKNSQVWAPFHLKQELSGSKFAQWSPTENTDRFLALQPWQPGFSRHVLGRLNREARAALELFVLPMLCAVLPWRWGYKFVKMLSRFNSLFLPQTASALKGANGILNIESPGEWCQHIRQVQLVDHADLWLSRTRGYHWFEKNVDVEGQWPKNGKPFIAITYHWGAGLWSIRDLGHKGFKTAFLSMKLNAEEFNGDSVRYTYARTRLAEVERAGGSEIISQGGSIDAMRKTLAEGKCVMALMDAPPGKHSTINGKLLGRDAVFCRGLLRFAVDEGIPVVAYTMSFDRVSGQRKLHISESLPIDHEEALLDALQLRLSEALESDAASWHFWGLVDQFISLDRLSTS